MILEKDFTFRLCGCNIPVTHSDPGNWQQSGMGRSNSLTGAIELSTKLTDVTRAPVFIHEMLHLALDFHGFDKESSNEHLVNAISHILLSWMRDNQELVREIAQS